MDPASLQISPTLIETEDQKLLYWKSFDVSRVPWIERQGKRIVKLLNKQRRAIKAEIGRANTVGVLEDIALNALNDRDIRESWQEELVKGYVQTVKYYGEEVMRLILNMKAQSRFNVFADAVTRWIATTVATQITNINNTTEGQIRSTIMRGYAEGLAIPKIAKSIDKLFLESIIPKRSVVIARTEVIGASNYGSYASVRQSGRELLKEWLITMDDRVRDTHQAMNGRPPIEMNDYFVLPSGAALMFPGDPSAPVGEIVQCRCTLIYKRRGDL